MKKSIDSELSSFYKRVGENVAKARKKKGMSQLDLSIELNYKSSSAISQPEICYNNTHFSLGQLFLIAKKLEIDISELTK